MKNLKFDEYWKKNKFNLTLFDDPVDPTPDPEPEPEETGGIILAEDIAPEIAIDHVNRFTTTLSKFFKVLGLTRRTPRPAGSTVKVYAWTGELETSPDEGETIPLTKLQRELVATYDIVLEKYRGAVSAEAIQAKGRERAINEKDEALVKKVMKKIKTGFYTTLNNATGTSTAGATLQATLANAWASVSAHFEDEDVTPIFFVNTNDVATYLAGATVTMQTAFGFSYIENFLGLGTAVVTTAVTRGTVIATCAENLCYDYIPARGGDLANVFGLTSDGNGYVGMRHTVNSTDASIETLVMSGGVLYAEDASGVFKGTISGV